MSNQVDSYQVILVLIYFNNPTIKLTKLKQNPFGLTGKYIYNPPWIKNYIAYMKTTTKLDKTVYTT